MFAVIKTGGKQYKVTKGMTLDLDRLKKDEGASVSFRKVLLIADGGDTKIGMPFVNGAEVSAKVVGHKRGDKIRVFKMKPKKRYQKTQGHRQELTTVEILDIKASGAKKAAPKVAKAAPKKEKAEKVEGEKAK